MVYSVIYLISFLKSVEVLSKCIEDLTDVNLEEAGLQDIGTNALAKLDVDKLYQKAKEKYDGESFAYVSWVYGHKVEYLWSISAGALHCLENYRLSSMYKQVIPLMEKHKCNGLNSEEKKDVLKFAADYALKNIDPFFFPEAFFKKLKAVLVRMNIPIIPVVEKENFTGDYNTAVALFDTVVTFCINELIGQFNAMKVPWMSDPGHSLVLTVNEMIRLHMLRPDYNQLRTTESQSRKIEDLKFMIKETVELTISIFSYMQEMWFEEGKISFTNGVYSTELENKVLNAAIYFKKNGDHQILPLGLNHWTYLPPDNTAAKRDYDRGVRSTIRYLTVSGVTQRRKQANRRGACVLPKVADLGPSSLSLEAGNAAPKLPSILSGAQQFVEKQLATIQAVTLGTEREAESIYMELCEKLDQRLKSETMSL